VSILLLFGGAGVQAPVTTYKHVLEVVRVAFLASSLPAQLSDGELHEGTAPHGAALPYATVFEVSDTADGVTTRQTALRSVELQFSIHAASAKDAKDLGQLFIDEFDRAALSDLDQWSIPLCTATVGLLLPGRRKGPRGEDCHIQTINVECFLTRK
jgi:hypothetical protein